MSLNMIQDNASPMSVAIPLATLIICIIAYHVFRARGLPPGPIGIPFFGYWPFLNNATGHLKLDNLKKKYGDVFSFTSTGTLYINLGSHIALREVHVTNSDCFAGRPQEFTLMNQIFDGGVFVMNGDSWKTLRKFFIQVFKERLAFKNSTLDSMYDCMLSVITHLKTANGEPINIIELFTNKCSTILKLTLFGDNVISDAQIKEVCELYGKVVASMTPSNMLLAGRCARYFIFPLMPEYREGLRNHKKIEELLYRIIDEHKSTFREDNIRDILDEFLKERNKRRILKDPTAQYFTDKALMASLIQFIGDGVLAVSTTICLIIKVLIEHPEEQLKIYNELMEVVGPDRQPTLEDRSRLVYLNAFVLEALRTSDFLPFFPSLECTKETSISGYRIPEGAVTLINMHSIHSDPTVYHDPEKFNPSRFISRDGKKKEEFPVTFGMGKRSCSGEAFTTIQIFLFVATLLKNFHLTLPNDVSDNPFDLFLSGKLLISATARNNE